MLDDGDGFSIFVGAHEARGEVWGKLEANPARKHDPDGCSLLPLGELPSVARIMWNTGQELLAPGCTLPEARLKRVDVARDFREVSAPSTYVRGLAGVRRPYASRAYVFANPSRGMAETLAVGSGSGMVRLYDQHEAYAEKGAPEGSLRWELEARSRWLGRVDLERVGDWTEEAVSDLARERWDWSGCGLEVSGTQAVIRRVLDSELTPAKRERLLGRLLLTAHGFPTGGGRNTDYRYDQLVRDLGVLLAPEVLAREDDQQPTVSGRLDFDTGREVLHAA